MQKDYISLGLMSGTSGDGVDASIIKSNGVDKFEPIKDKYFEYDSNIYQNIHSLKDQINNKNDLEKFSGDLKDLERKITLFHAQIIKEFEVKSKSVLVGFHGQTIYHNFKEKISKQLGDANLLHQLTKKKIIFNFRKNDILNGGQGAPLVPIFHQLLTTKKKITLPVCILNIGGISNITIIKGPVGSSEFYSKDIGPGNCLIDNWIRKNSKKKYDEGGFLAATGKKNEIILEQAQELYINRKNKKNLSFDTNDFDISFARGLSLEDGTATLTFFSASIIAQELLSSIKAVEPAVKDILICGGGRKNQTLINYIKNNLPSDVKLTLIDNFKINGDFVESQAFAFLAIRSIKDLPITFPNTTGCHKPLTGGDLVDN